MRSSTIVAHLLRTWLSLRLNAPNVARKTNKQTENIYTKKCEFKKTEEAIIVKCGFFSEKHNCLNIL